MPLQIRLGERADSEHPRLVLADVIQHRPDERRSDTLSLELRVDLRVQHRDEAGLPVLVSEARDVRADPSLVLVPLRVVPDDHLAGRVARGRHSLAS